MSSVELVRVLADVDEASRHYILEAVKDAIEEGTFEDVPEVLVSFGVVASEEEALLLCNTMRPSDQETGTDQVSELLDTPLCMAEAITPPTTKEFPEDKDLSMTVPLRKVKVTKTAPEGYADADDDTALVPQGRERLERMTFDAELHPKAIFDMSPSEMREMILLIGEGSKRRGLWVALAKEVDTQDVGGDVLLSGGPSLLVDIGRRAVPQKQLGSLKHVANRVFEAFAEMEVERSVDSYWDRLLDSSYAGHQLGVVVGSSALGDVLRDALSPQPLDTLRYTLVDGLANTNVKNADAQVCKFSSAVCPHKFKIVAVVGRDAPSVVCSNLIYYRDATTKVWQNIASIDFATHGEAPTGHWHLNTSPDGSSVQHWGPRNEVFHGDPSCCPLWWSLIPCGFTHKEVPNRFRQLMKT